MDIVALIFNMVIDVATLLLFLRFMMQLAALDPYNPVVMSTIRVTHIADVFSRIIPSVGHGRINLAALALIALLRMIDLSGNALLGGMTFDSPLLLLSMTIIGLLKDALTFFYWLIIASIVLSWVVVFTQSRSPYIGVVMQMAEPLLAPFRRIMPDLGPIDLSPLLAFLAIIICQKMLDYAAMSVLSLI